MDIGAGKGWPESGLSNFSPHAFIFRGCYCASMEGLLQALKFDDPAVQLQVMLLIGIAAKRRGKKKNWWKTQTLYWQGKPIDRHSNEYQDLLTEAFTSMFSQCDSARRALIASGKSNLEHSIGKSDPHQTVLTRSEFTTRLTLIRTMLEHGTLPVKQAPEPIALRQKKERLTHLLARMDVPAMRRNWTAENLRWLSRNLLVRNAKHLDFPEAMTLIKKLLRCRTPEVDTKAVAHLAGYVQSVVEICRDQPC